MYPILLTIESKLKDGDQLTDAEREVLIKLVDRERRTNGVSRRSD